MPDIEVVDRVSKETELEPVYGGWALDFVYSDTLVARLLGRPLLHLFLKTSLFSWLYGLWQKSSLSKGKVLPFITKFKVDTSEFLFPADTFSSFNEFFVRKLNPASRPISDSPAIVPADGRYRFIQNIDLEEGFLVKGKKFSITSLLDDSKLADRYKGGSMVIARLCPTDYHRFHFPCDATPGRWRLINGWLYSVNPIATKKHIHTFTENKRTLTQLHSKQFGEISYLEIGATCVGSINQTYTPNTQIVKGDEKGFFSFGASSLIILFEPASIQFDQDLLELSQDMKEIRCLMGQSMGK
jgi:phosphatidylserine decarboxylase